MYICSVPLTSPSYSPSPMQPDCIIQQEIYFRPPSSTQPLSFDVSATKKEGRHDKTDDSERERSRWCMTKASKCHSLQAFRLCSLVADSLFEEKTVLCLRVQTFRFELNKILKNKRNLISQAAQTHNKMVYSAV